MRSILAGFVTAAVVFLGLLALRPVPVAAARAPGDDARAFLQTYCITCHSQQMKSRGTVPVAFDTLDASAVANDAKTWETVVRKMRAGVMPPAGMKRPDKAAHEQFLAWVEGELDRAARERPNPGRTEAFHRLNRTEYRNAVRDLLDLDVDVTGWLPPDDASYGFDNIAGVLKISPTLLERYLSAAQKVSRTALGIAPPSPTVDYFRVADDRAQEQELPGQPFGTRGGASIRYTFPMDASYTVRVQLSRDLNEQVPIYVEPQDLEVSIDGERVNGIHAAGCCRACRPSGERARGGKRRRRRATRRTWAGSWHRGACGRRGTRRRPPGAGGAQSRRPRLGSARAGEGRTARRAGGVREREQCHRRDRASAIPPAVSSRRQHRRDANGCLSPKRGDRRTVRSNGSWQLAEPAAHPDLHAGHPANEEACSTRILTALARRAFRRPVTAADVRPLLAFYREGRAEGSFDQGIERALNRLLISPEFLLRVETDPPKTPPGTAYRINDVSLASRLSFFLWNSIPDEELLTLAEQKRLNDPAVLDRQVRRMIADSRFDSFVETFAGQWLFLRNLPASVPVQQNYPDFDDTLRQAFRTETELFFKSVVREDRSALDLLRADYTFLNERLAGHYGIADVKGTRFRRVTLPPGSRRGGLLSQGSILTVTSYPDRTSPVVRGKWILENLLGTPPPSPPPGVPPLKPPSFATKVLSVRERMIDHRRNPPCAGCHAMMDPLGLALENFDAVGKWRALDESGGPIDASGAMPDGTKFDGADGLRQALLGSDRFVMTLTEKLMTYALGRGVDYYDEPAVRGIVRTASRDDFRFVSLIRGVVQSVPFQMRRAK